MRKFSTTMGSFAAVLLATASSQAYAQEAQAPADSSNSARTAANEVIVVGTARADVTALQSNSPVDVLNAEELSGTGASSVTEALSQLAPSINFLRYTGIGATAGTSSPQLRGLGPDQVLVLVNGRRRHAAAQIHGKVGYGRGAQAVDTNTIPFAGVQRVELLRDGASAQYGSDAIAGVVNFVLREDDSGGGFSTQIGANYDGGGDGETLIIDGWKGFSLSNEGFLTLAGSFSNINGTGPAKYADSRAQYYAGDPNTNPNVDRRNRQNSPDFREYNFLLNSELPLTTDLTAYAFGTAGQRITEKTGVRRRPLDDQTVRAIFPQGYTPYQRATSTDYAFTGGIEFDAHEAGQFDLSATYGRNRIEYEVFDTLNPSLGPNQRTHYYNGALVNAQTNVNLDWVKDVQVFSDPLIVSAGLNFTNEEYTIEAGEPLSYRQGGVTIIGGPNNGLPAQGETVGYSPFRPEDSGTFDRNIWGLNVGFEQSFGNLNLGLAGRYENYSDFGDTTTGKFSARYDFTPAFAVRGTASTGFRAPSIGQQNWSATTVTWSTITPGTYTEVRTVPVSHPWARALGAPELQPETSTNYSAGFVWRPVDRASLSFDAYRIDVDDRITLTENFTNTNTPGLNAFLAPYGFVSGSGISFFTNAVDTRTEGFDIVAKYTFDIRGGALDVSLAYNQNETEITQRKPFASPPGLTIPTLVGRESSGLIERLSPENKVSLTFDYSGERWGGTFIITRYGEYGRNHANNPALDATYGPDTVVDANISYKFTPDFRLTLGARNLLDAYPDYDPLTSVTNGGEPYTSFAPRGSDGGYYYLTAAYNF
ncbi:MAG: TonB-dependent receptor [Caulobacterales bacterium]